MSDVVTPNQQTEAPLRKGWIVAAGSCGFNLDARQVWACYHKGVALFVWPYHDGKGYTYAVTGHMSGLGRTLESAMVQAEGVAAANGTHGADRRMSRKQFDKVTSNPERLARR